NAYSVPSPISATPRGAIHGMGPHGYIFGTTTPPSPTDPGVGPFRPNHNPLETGDNLTLPTAVNPPALQTWWGFPICGGVLNGNWIDPVKRVNDAAVGFGQSPGLSLVTVTPLPPQPAQPFNDGAGGAAFLPPSGAWQDDLIMTGVRSFDVKAYDDATAAYQD